MIVAALVGAATPWALLVNSFRGPVGSTMSRFGGAMPI
jgi:hypothetical protein